MMLHRFTQLSKLSAHPRVTSQFARGIKLLGIALTGFLLVGCAAQMAFRDGKALVAEGKVEEGLTKLQEASTQEPHDAEYRAAYLRARERALSSYLEQADRLAASGQNDQAEPLYRHALALDPSNERARAGLQTLDTAKRHALWLQEASTAVNKKDAGSAKLKLANILTENPTHEQARALQRSLAENTTTLSMEGQLAAKYKKPISIEFKDVALKVLFEVIARTSGLNFLFDRDVKTDQKTSIFLKNSTIESVVHFTLLTNQLEQQVLDANTVLIYPNTPAKQKDYQEMVVRSFFLANAEAKAVANTLKTIVKSRDIVIDEKLNLLIVRDSPEAIRLAEKLIALQDVAEPEVMLEVEVLEIAHTRLQQLGIQWPASLGLTPLALAVTPTASTGTGSGSTTVTPPNSLSLNDLLHQNSRSLSATIGTTTANANVQDTDSNLLANPRIRARNHEKAKILIGERVPNITTTSTATGFASESINYVDVGLTLNVEPTVYLDNDVAIKVSLEVSNVISQIKTQTGSTAYEIGTRTASTVLRLKDGETQVLAGLINDQDRRSGNKIPGLGEIPILGHLFGNRTTDREKSEIVLAITPHLIRNIQRPDATQAEFRAGTENSLRNRPESPSGGPSESSTPQVASPPGTATLPLPTPNSPPAPPPGTGAAYNSGGINNGTINNGADAMPASAQLSWQGPAQVKVGGTLTLNLALQSTQPISSLPISIAFDTKVLQAINIVEGDFLKQGGAQTGFTSRIDPSGQILISDAVLNGGGAGATAAGTVTSITFRTLTAADTTHVQLSNAALSGVGGVPIATTLPAPYTVQVLP
ncbi:general secretion pathway protein D [Collimonas sp. OK307]|uniref:secretin N-terminal domain-containing protein n=1 Tax=Collimonas sp. OK307 TaxID=1801620 RepID=UPI0008EBA344|nr:secretin N-terminal domain-containing protein [Collimonas sp. OK307]SFI22061.1 general secretion pathway protein D [Collimonas sp. OK307]